MLAASLLVMLAAGAASATTYTVTADTNSGPGSLRQAILDANANPGADTIVIQPAVGWIWLGSELVVTDSVTITAPGLGVVIGIGAGAGNWFRVFNFAVGTTSSISGLRIRDGGIRNFGTLTATNVSIYSTVSDVFGGTFGGGINNQGTLTLVNSELVDNRAQQGAGIAVGNAGTATVTNSTIDGNVADYGGGIFVSPGGTLTVTNSEVFDNAAHFNGGGIYNFKGTATVTNSTLSNNRAIGQDLTGYGGAIYSDTSIGGTLTLTNSMFLENSAAFAGGGISSDGTLAMTNSTVSKNGAFAAGGIVAGGTLTLTNCTVAANLDWSDNGAGAGIAPFQTGLTPTAVSTIVAGNFNSHENAPFDVSATFAAGSINNLIQDAAHAGGLTNGVNGNIVGVDPLLGDPGDNGGPTQTMALRPGSPAINAGACAPGVTTDQRGVARPQGAACDIGAFEVVPPPQTTTALTSTLNPSVVGQSVTFTATVAVVAPGVGTPIGTVTFKDGATTLGNGTLNAGGVATFSTSALSGGPHSISATYNGAASFSASTSPVLTQTVNQKSTTTALTSSPNPSVLGQSVTFTATVAAVAPGAGTPSGTVAFKDGTTLFTIGEGTLNAAGVATLSTNALPAGPHSITAVYNGPGLDASTSPALNQIVNSQGAIGDADGDGVLDANDGCPNDRNKTAPGVCGCGKVDVDANGNGVADCIDPTVGPCPGNITVTATNANGIPVEFITFVGNSPLGAATVTTKPATGSILPVGVTPVTVTVTDINGVTASCTFPVTVKPLSGSPAAGQTPPQEVNRDQLKGLLSLVFGAPICGTGIVSAMPLMILGLMGVKARRRRSRR